MMKVKICGLSRAEDIEIVNRLQPDYIGFVFYNKSKRAVTLEQAAALKNKLSPKIKTVGVFVNAEISFIIKLVQEKIIDLVQLHGDEVASYCEKLRGQITVPIIKAVRVKDADSLAGLERFPADYLLLDTYEPGMYGGTGKRWRMQPEWETKINKPYFIAGGLTAENVAELTEKTNAFAVDVSGGVEIDGVKNSEKIAAFIAQVRGEKL